MNTNTYPCQTAVGRELLGTLVHLSMVHYFLCLMREKSDSDWRESVTQRVTLLFLSFLCFFFIWKSSSVICIRSSSQLKVTRCLQIKSRSFDRTGWPKSLRSEEEKKNPDDTGLLQLCLCVCVNNTHLLVHKGNVSVKTPAAVSGPVSCVSVCECLRIL